MDAQKMKSSDVEGAPSNLSNFMDDKTIRHKFITKVYSILTAQILYTIAIVIVSMNVDTLQKFMAAHSALIYISSSLIAFGILIAMSCITSLRRTYPLNFILLSIFTSFVALELSVLSVVSPLKNVYLACFLTGSLFVLLTGLAYANIFDISNAGLFICLSSLVLMVLSTGLAALSTIFNVYYKPLHIILTVLILLVVLIYIVYDTQLIIGEGKVKLSEEEYIEATILLYVDLISLFKIILTILNQLSRD